MESPSVVGPNWFDHFFSLVKPNTKLAGPIQQGKVSPDVASLGQGERPGSPAQPLTCARSELDKTI
jgi:hypothetical protein